MPSEIQSLPPLSGYLMFGSDIPVVRGEISPVDYPIIAPRLIARWESSSSEDVWDDEELSI